MKKILTALSLLACTAGLSSANAAQDYDFLQVHGVVKSEYSDVAQFDLKGFELRGSKSWGNVFTELRYRDLSDSDNSTDFDENRWSASVGYILPFSKQLHFDVRANYGNIDAEISNQNGQVGFDVDYYGASGFAHYGVTSNFDVYAGLEYQNIKDAPDQKAYHLGATYAFDALSIGTEYVKYSDSDALGLFLRYSF